MFLLYNNNCCLLYIVAIINVPIVTHTFEKYSQRTFKYMDEKNILKYIQI